MQKLQIHSEGESPLTGATCTSKSHCVNSCPLCVIDANIVLDSKYQFLEELEHGKVLNWCEEWGTGAEFTINPLYSLTGHRYKNSMSTICSGCLVTVDCIFGISLMV